METSPEMARQYQKNLKRSSSPVASDEGPTLPPTLRHSEALKPRDPSDREFSSLLDDPTSTQDGGQIRSSSGVVSQNIIHSSSSVTKDVRRSRRISSIASSITSGDSDDDIDRDSVPSLPNVRSKTPMRPSRAASTGTTPRRSSRRQSSIEPVAEESTFEHRKQTRRAAKESFEATPKIASRKTRSSSRAL